MTEIEVDRTPLWVPLAAAVIRRLPRGRYRAMQWLARRQRPFIARLPGELGGLRFACYVQDSKMRDVCFGGRYEPLETALVAALVKPGHVFVDVGTNWGYFTLIAAARVGASGRVLGIECDPRQLAILQRNVGLNDVPWVEVVAVAASDGPGTLTLQGYDEREQNWGLSKVVTGAAAGERVFHVPARALDEVLDERRIARVDFLKMDIEGAEELALAGMARGLACGRYARILLELHPAILAERGSSAAAVVRRLLDAGYRGWWLDHSAETQRRAAYARSLLEPRTFLRPLAPSDALDVWPHALFIAPGVDGAP